MIDLTARQARALDTLLDLPPSGNLTEAQLFAKVWGLEVLELELLFDEKLVEYFYRRTGRVWWLSARGRRYALELRVAREKAIDDAERCGASGTALQSVDHASPTDSAEPAGP